MSLYYSAIFAAHSKTLFSVSYFSMRWKSKSVKRRKVYIESKE